MPEFVVACNEGGEVFEVWERGVYPTISTALSMRIDACAKGVVDRFVCSLVDAGFED